MPVYAFIHERGGFIGWGPGESAPWSSLVGCCRAQGVDHGVRVKFEVEVNAGRPSPVWPAGGRGWRAIGGVQFVHASVRVGLAWSGRTCDNYLACEYWRVGLRDGWGMWGAVRSGLDVWSTVQWGGKWGCEQGQEVWGGSPWVGRVEHCAVGREVGLRTGAGGVGRVAVGFAAGCGCVRWAAASRFEWPAAVGEQGELGLMGWWGRLEIERCTWLPRASCAFGIGRCCWGWCVAAGLWDAWRWRFRPCCSKVRVLVECRWARGFSQGSGRSQRRCATVSEAWWRACKMAGLSERAWEDWDGVGVGEPVG
jgi:hypothetical protein